MAIATKTLNPLHFEDLEPHRFEDLVRQLIYDFRVWRSLEATGRLGSDDGYDARGFEIIEPQSEQAQEDDGEEGEDREMSQTGHNDRIWQIQCKREKTITPEKIRTYLEEIIPEGADIPYGLIFAAPCDFSKKTRDVFQKELRERGVQEFYLWGKADLEDTLLQPKNDHLLYAYFGISLTIRRRTVKSQIRSLLAIKRKAIKYLGPLDEKSFVPVLIRNVEDTNYPYSTKVPDFQKNANWKMYYFVGHVHDGIKIRVRTYPAYREIDFEKMEVVKWDFTDEVNLDYCHEDLWHKKVDSHDGFRRAHDFLDSMPENNRAFFELEAVVPYDRIIEIDPIGDAIVQSPHVFVEVRNNKFWGRILAYLRPRGDHGSEFWITSEDNKKRIKYFPKKLPKAKPFPPLPPMGLGNTKSADNSKEFES
jgi:hypothetical protein